MIWYEALSWIMCNTWTQDWFPLHRAIGRSRSASSLLPAYDEESNSWAFVCAWSGKSKKTSFSLFFENTLWLAFLKPFLELFHLIINCLFKMLLFLESLELPIRDYLLFQILLDWSVVIHTSKKEIHPPQVMSPPVYLALLFISLLPGE